MIEKRRAQKPFATTRDLASAIEAAMPRKPQDKIHPATRVFQALRIHVNDELGELVEALKASERILKPGGVLAVVTFHSLEDRIVKSFFADRAGKGSGSRHLPETVARRATFEVAGKAFIVPDEAELAANPRARSAKLRAGIRTDAAATRTNWMQLPDLPALAHGGV
jgi:16S rRNA (cytosine1402-N4)-methyltransferase